MSELIRLAKEKDLPQIVELCKEHAAFEQSQYDPTNKTTLLAKQLFTKNPKLKCLLAEEENEIMAYATFMKQFSTWDADFYVYLDCLFIKEDYRRRGLGRLFMDRIIEHAKMENCSMVQWQTPHFNSKAIKFYQNIGGASQTKERFYLKL